MFRSSALVLILIVWVAKSDHGDWVDVKVAEGVHRPPQMPKASKAPKGSAKGATAKDSAARAIGYGPPLMALFDDVRCFNASGAAFAAGEGEEQSAAEAYVGRFCPRYNVTVTGGGPAAGTYGISGYRAESIGKGTAEGGNRLGRRKAKPEVRRVGGDDDGVGEGKAAREEGAPERYIRQFLCRGGLTAAME